MKLILLCNRTNKLIFFRYADKILNISDKMFEIAIKSVEPDDDFNVLMHGDFSITNMLFRYDEFGKPIDCKMVSGTFYS